MVRRVHPTNDFIEFKTEALGQSIPARFEQQVRRYPDRLAVKSGTQRLTYTELNAVANRVARTLLAQRGRGEGSVALLFEWSTSLVVGLLGALKAARICVPVNPSFPRARLRSTLEDSQAQVILTDRKHMALARDLARNGRHCLDVDALDGSLSPQNLDMPIPPDRLAALIYTSGSTGQPKGVMQTHRNFLHTAMIETNLFHLCPSDRVTNATSPGGAGAIWTILRALLNGAAFVPLDIQRIGVGHLATWLIQEEITVFTALAVIRQFSATLSGTERFPKIRLVTLGRDTVYPSDVELVRKHFGPHCRLFVGLGSTEVGRLTQYFLDKDAPVTGSVVPVGYPVPDIEILLLGEDGQDVGVDAVGEIAVRSQYLSPGYWRRPELTRDAFRPDPGGGPTRIYRTGDLGRRLPDGCLVHLGRTDFQVKIRGYRVEVAEIEGALRNLATLKEAVVVAQEARPGEQRLVAYLVPATRPAPTVSALRRALAASLPDSMIPSTFVMMDRLPLTATGKVDRLALPAPSRTRPELDARFVAPRTRVEAILCAIWGEVLGLDQVGIHDHFLELGGHSLAASRVITRILERFGVDLPLRTLFEAPTVVQVAVVIVESLVRCVEREERGRILAALDQPSEEEAHRLLTRGMRQRGGGTHG